MMSKIKLLAIDVDGVLTDGGMYYSEKGDELKKFNTRDGMGIAMLQKKGIVIALITGEKSKIVLRRAKKLRIKEVYLGIEDKLEIVKKLCKKYKVSEAEIAYIGDDVNDICVLKEVGLSIAVADAIESVKTYADYITKARGGNGAVREVCDLILDNLLSMPN